MLLWKLLSLSGKTPRRGPNRLRGFTLIEVLVASSVSLILGLALVQMFFYSSKQLAATTGRMEMVQAARIPIDRVQQVLASAVGTTRTEGGTFRFPSNGIIGINGTGENERGQTLDKANADTWYRYVIVRTTEDLLADNFNSNEIFELPTMAEPQRSNLVSGYRTENQIIFDYIIWFEDDAVVDRVPNIDKALVVGRIQQQVVGGTAVARLMPWAEGDPWADLENAPGGGPRIRVLARNLEDVSFLLNEVALNVSVKTTKNFSTVSGGREDKDFRLDAWVQIPSEIMSVD